MGRVVCEGLRALLSRVIVKELDDEGLLDVWLRVNGLNIRLGRRGGFLDGMGLAFFKICLRVFGR